MISIKAILLAVVAGLSVGAISGGLLSNNHYAKVIAQNALEFQSQLADKNNHIAEMSEAIATANAAIDVAKAKSDAAVEAKNLAVAHAQEMADLSRSREERLAEMGKTAKSCADVLTNYWELRR